MSKYLSILVWIMIVMFVLIASYLGHAIQEEAIKTLVESQILEYTP